MRKKRGLVAVLALSMLIQGVAGGITGNRVYAEEVRSDSTVQMSSEKEVVNLASFSKDSKRTEGFNDDWKFYLGEAGNAEVPNFDDSKWTGTDLPHDYSIHQEFLRSMEAESGYLDGGIGWYRKHFNLSEEMKDKEFRIDFDGVYMDATVWVNGQYLGNHPYGYTPFSFNISKYLKFDESDNVIAVKVNHKTPSSRWYSGSGIYRDVKLQIMNKVHVDLNGVKIETPGLDKNKQDVAVKINTKVVNALNEAKEVKVRAKIFKKGEEATGSIGEGISEVRTAEAGKVSDVLLNLTAKSPKLWDTETPNLYTVRVEVLNGEAVVDTYETDYGFRWFSADKNTGAYLNGKNIKLKGVCMHHDQGALGAAAYKRATERQVEILQNMGCNSIRVTHNPASQVLIDICNEKGILLVEEIFDGWMHSKNGNINDYGKWFEKKIETGNTLIGAKADMTWAEFDMKAAISRGQNAPAIVMWSIGNEIQEGASGGGYSEKAKDLIKWGKEADSTRMLTIGSNKVKSSFGSSEHINIANQLTKAGGMSGTNYSNGNSYDKLHRSYPNWLLYGSETASSVNSRGVYTEVAGSGLIYPTLNKDKQLTSYDASRVFWGALASEAWYDVITRDFVAGEYVWTGFDYIGEPTPANGMSSGAQGSWPSPKNSYFGIIDTAGFPKDSYYLYQSQWNDKKHTLHILPAWNENVVRKSGGNKVKVVVYSDAAKVDLQLNGKSQGIKEFKKTTTKAGYTYQTVNGQPGHENLYMTWEVPYEDGTLEAIAYDEQGKRITDTDGCSVVKTTKAAAKLVVKADRNKITADGKDLSYITVDVTDEEGNIIPDAKDEVKFSIEGAGTIAGTDNGSSPDHTPYNSLTRKAHAGKVLAIVKSDKKAGTITVKAEARGLIGETAVITTEALKKSEGKNIIESFYMVKNYYVKKGNKPVLPATLTARYTNGDSIEENVVWDEIKDGLINEAGTFEVTGRAADKKVSVNITMIDEISGLLNYSATTPKNTPVKLPDSRPAVLQDGTEFPVSFPVRWEDVPASKYNEAGNITVNGKANVLGKEFKITASVRVQEEKITLGSNVAGVATLSQNIPSDMQSDNLDAIKDGKTSKGIGTIFGNKTIWSNYKYSQEGHTKAEITFAFDTQQRIGEAVIHFGKDNNSIRYPDPGKTKLQVSEDNINWQDVTTAEEIGSEDGDVKPYTYKFSPVNATFVKLCITNTAMAIDTGKKACTGITEVELKSAIGSYSENDEAKLEALTINDEVISSEILEKGVYETPAQIVELKEIKTAGNAAYTLLPEYQNEIKILLESENHKNKNKFVIRFNQETQGQEEELKEYPREKLTAIAVSEYDNGDAHEGPAKYVIDGKFDTHWHTNYSFWGEKADTPEKRTINLELAEAEEIAELQYYPRTYGGSNGFITDYRVEVKSLTEDKWIKVSEGSWKQGEEKWQKAKFDTSVKTKNVRLVAVHTYSDKGDDKHASAAELKLMLANKKDELNVSNSSIEIEGLVDGKIEVVKVNEKYPVRPAVKVIYNGSMLRQGIDYKLKYLNNTAVGMAKVEITGIIKYSGKLEKDFEIIQKARELETIFIAANPKKTTYKEGEKFDPSGLKLTLNYSDGTTDGVSFEGHEAEFKFKPSLNEELKAGAYSIIVDYQGKEAKVDIVVEENKPNNNGNGGGNGGNNSGGNAGNGNNNNGSGNPGNGTNNNSGGSTGGGYAGPSLSGGSGQNNTNNNLSGTAESKAKPDVSDTEITEDLTPQGAVKEDIFSRFIIKLDKNDKIKAKYIQKKLNRSKGLTLEQFAKELVNKKIIAKVGKNEVHKFLKGVKTSKWARTYMAALVKTGVLNKKTLKNTKKKVSEKFVVEILEKLMIKPKK